MGYLTSIYHINCHFVKHLLLFFVKINNFILKEQKI